MANLTCPWELKSFCRTRSIFYEKEYLCTVEPSFTTFFRLQEEKQLWYLGEPGKGDARHNPVLDQILSVRRVLVCV